MSYAICARDRVIGLVLLCVLSGWARAQENPGKNQQDTETETLYRNRYSNCDNGYVVDLPAGVVAHRDKAAFNRGFQIDLSAPQSAKPFSASEQRLIAVSNRYNTQELPAFGAIVENEIELAQEDSPDWNVLERLPIKLDGLQATHLRARFKGKKMVNEDIIAFRPGVSGHGDLVYKIQLITLQASYAEDRRMFDAIVGGFHVLPWGATGCQ